MQAVPTPRPRRLLLALVTTAVVALMGAGVASAATYTVNTTTDSATPCSSSGSCSLRGAVIAADSAGGSSTIDVPAGLYKLTIAPSGSNDQTTGDLNITSGANVTVVGAGSDSTTIDGNNLDRQFNVAQGASLALSGLTLRRGQANSGEGGAILTDGTLTIGNSSTGKSGDVTFTSNSDQNGGCAGGAIYADTDSAVSLTGTVFDNNNNDCSGGAIYDSSSHLLTIGKSTFEGNQGTDEEGGAIYGDTTAPLTVTHSTFSSNSAPDGGAIAWVSSGALTANYDRFTGNSADSDGGAVYLDGSAAYTFDHDLFSGNASTDDYGGAIYWDGGTLESSSSTFVHNLADYGDDGGAIYAGSGLSLTLINDTISRNGVGDECGGGISVESDGPTPASLINDTITGNSADPGCGGGIYGTADLTTVGYSGPGTPGIENTVIADNTGGDCNAVFSPTFDLGHNMDSDGSCFNGSTDHPSTEPNLGKPADNGGPLVGNTSDGSAVVIPTQAETSASPTVNAGTNTGCPSTDERGVARPQGGVCDIGAFELAAAKLSVKKSAPKSLRVHSVFTYKIKVSNSGPGFSTGTTLVDKIPSSETLKGVIANSGGSCTHSGRTVTCKIGDLRSGGSATVKIIVKANKTGKVKNTARATNDQGSKASGHVTTTVKTAAVKPARAKKKTSPKFTG